MVEVFGKNQQIGATRIYLAIFLISIFAFFLICFSPLFEISAYVYIPLLHIASGIALYAATRIWKSDLQGRK
jgi:hypothetical protein